jgi:hypothetical protein
MPAVSRGLPDATSLQQYCQYQVANCHLSNKTVNSICHAATWFSYFLVNFVSLCLQLLVSLTISRSLLLVTVSQLLASQQSQWLLVISANIYWHLKCS